MGCLRFGLAVLWYTEATFERRFLRFGLPGLVLGRARGPDLSHEEYAHNGGKNSTKCRLNKASSKRLMFQVFVMTFAIYFRTGSGAFGPAHNTGTLHKNSN